MPWEHGPALDAARDDVDEMIGKHVDALGPHALNEDYPDEEYVCAEWVLVMQWTGMESGDSFTTCTAPANVLKTHRNGLLHEALHNMPENDD